MFANASRVQEDIMAIVNFGKRFTSGFDEDALVTFTDGERQHRHNNHDRVITETPAREQSARSPASR